jgi:hypothetical protein
MFTNYRPLAAQLLKSGVAVEKTPSREIRENKIAPEWRA